MPSSAESPRDEEGPICPQGQGALTGQRVCVTGTLTAMSHAQFAKLVAECGGQFLSQPVKDKFLLVTGAAFRSSERDDSTSACLQRAKELQGLGYPIEFLSEEDFFSRIGLIEPESFSRGRYSIADLSRLLGVSAANLRRWTTLKLLEPAETVHGFAYFSFAEIGGARHLNDLVASGISPTRIRQSLNRFQSWLPIADAPLSQLSLVAQGGRVLMRWDNLLVEPSGQRHFDFEVEDAVESGVFSFPSTIESSLQDFDALFDQGLALEDQGRFEEAVEIYRQASRLSPRDAAVHFNLGNVFYQLGQYSQSLDSFREALRCDPQYAEAWNNLGNVLWRTGAVSDAIKSFVRAVALVPDYVDARRNLETLRQKLATSCFQVIS